MSGYDALEFEKFCNTLRIDTKERGEILLGRNLLGTQKWVMREIERGLGEGVHNFVTLKSRQIGISTISLALDLYWVFRHGGLSGALITHDEPSRDQFRTTLDMYYGGLPVGYKQRIVSNNRNAIVFGNKSRLSYRVAGVRAKGGGALGRSAALTFLHATEMSSWGDPEGLRSLKGSLAEHNALRFFHWESTARGFNHFFDMWEEAKRSITQRAIFVSFWANEFYRAERDSDIWLTYWGHKGRMTPAERDWVREVKALYDVDVDPPVIAWWRWKIAEEMGDEMMMFQEFPPTENHAFVATGSQFFSTAAVSNAYKAQRGEKSPEMYRIHVGTHFSSTALVACPGRVATLKVWEQPSAKGTYVLGADPAYGSSETADRFCLSVWRCYSDRLVQVAEFVDPDMATYSFAWVLAYLAGAYEPCLVNLEINGPGQGVLSELHNMRRNVVAGNFDSASSREARTLFSVTKNIGTYLYRRLDSINSMPGAIHTQTNFQMKERMMNGFRDYMERGFLQIRSKDLIDEMKGVARHDGGAPAAPTNAHDDRVIAAALACMAWNDQRRTQLIVQNATYENITNAEEKGPDGVVDRIVKNYLNRVSNDINARNARNARR